MNGIPFDPDNWGHGVLAKYLHADPRRLPVYDKLLSLLDADGSVGDLARHYVVRSSYRRGILRAVLIALGFPPPSWAKEGPGPAAANRAFVQSYRDEANRHRRAYQRQRHARTSRPDLNKPTRGHAPAYISKETYA